MGTLPQRAEPAAKLAVTVARHDEMLLDQGHELALLIAEYARFSRFLAAAEAMAANPGASYTDPKVAKIQARRQRIAASGLRVVR